MPSIAQDTLPAAPTSAPEQPITCATSADVELMRRADATRASYFASVRKSVIAAAGECEQ